MGTAGSQGESRMAESSPNPKLITKLDALAAQHDELERQLVDPTVVVDHQRVRELTLGLGHELAALDERGIELAAAEHDGEAQWLDGHRRLRAALADRVGALGAGAGELASKFAAVGAASQEMLDSAGSSS